MNDIFSTLPIIVFIPLCAILFILMSTKEQYQNIYNVCLLAIVANITIIWRLFYLIDPSSSKLQLITHFEWLKHLGISFTFGADVFSLFLILALHFAFLVILRCLRRQNQHPKTTAIFAMMFLGLTSGLFISADLFSFYLFFEAMLLPLFFITGIGGGLKKQEKAFSFFLYNIFASLLFFIAIIMIFNIDKSAYILENIQKIKFNSSQGYFIWGAILISMLSRLPIWPFHKMLSSITADTKNPLVFLVSITIPITAIYGFVRIFPTSYIGGVDIIIEILEVVAIISMNFIALIAFAHKDFQYKMFSYISIMYLFYLLAALTNNDISTINISLSFFGFIIAIAGIEILWQKYNLNNETFSNTLYILFSTLIFCLIGAPLSSILLNNFSILGILYQKSPIQAYFIFAAITIAAGSLISQIPKIKTTTDIQKTPKTLIFICFILLMSFIKPFWFVEL